MSENETPLAEAPAADPTTKIEMPGVEETPTEPKAETTETAGTAETAETDETGEAKKNIPGSQKLKRRLQLIEQEHSQALQELENLRREREQRANGTPQQRPGVDREPTEQDFPNDYFAYERAKTAWEVRQSVREEIRGQINNDRQSRAQELQAESRRERLMAYEDNKEAARERIPDFDKVVSSAADVTIKPEVVEELLASDKSALLQYHLAKNPDKARELNGMTGRELAREIGRLESRVHLPTPKKATEASPPPKEIKGGAAPTVDPQTGPDDMNAYVAWRKKQAS